MKQFKIQGHASLREEMKAVARGEKPAPQDAGGTTFDSVEALMRLLTPQNRHLMAVIRDKKRNQSPNSRCLQAARSRTSRAPSASSKPSDSCICKTSLAAKCRRLPFIRSGSASILSRRMIGWNWPDEEEAYLSKKKLKRR